MVIDLPGGPGGEVARRCERALQHHALTAVRDPPIPRVPVSRALLPASVPALRALDE